MLSNNNDFCEVNGCSSLAEGFKISVRGLNGGFHDMKLCIEHKQLFIDELVKWIMTEGANMYKSKVIME